jgi:hypothetical protein
MFGFDFSERGVYRCILASAIPVPYLRDYISFCSNTFGSDLRIPSLNHGFRSAFYHLWVSFGSMYGSVLVELVHIPFSVLLSGVYLCRRGGVSVREEG